MADGVIIVPPVGAQHAAPLQNMILPATTEDWLAFQKMTQQEGWRVPQHEFALHRQGGCSQSWALRSENSTIGLVTGVRHRSSAWIGNLIIAEAQRGRGYGAALFEHVIKKLRAAGATTLWLTASAQGASLYAARGFQSVRTIERWVRTEGGDGVIFAAAGAGGTIDSAVWGDDRSALLHHLEEASRWIEYRGSLALLQNGDDLQIIGPWYGSKQPQEDKKLLTKLIAAAAPHQELVVDLVAGSGRQGLLTAAGFLRSGSTSLMVAGRSQVHWSRLVALATLGSCG